MRLSSRNYKRQLYLEKLVCTRTPSWEEGMPNDERYQQCWDYCELRNAARDLLRDPGDTRAEERLQGLRKKLKIH